MPSCFADRHARQSLRRVAAQGKGDRRSLSLRGGPRVCRQKLADAAADRSAVRHLADRSSRADAIIGAARIGCIDRIDSGLSPLLDDDVAAIAFWRDRIFRAGGIAGTLDPFCELLYRGLAMPRDGERGTRQADVDAASLDLPTLKCAYAAVLARRRGRRARRDRRTAKPSSTRLPDAVMTSTP